MTFSSAREIRGQYLHRDGSIETRIARTIYFGGVKSETDVWIVEKK